MYSLAVSSAILRHSWGPWLVGWHTLQSVLNVDLTKFDLALPGPAQLQISYGVTRCFLFASWLIHLHSGFFNFTWGFFNLICGYIYLLCGFLICAAVFVSRPFYLQCHFLMYIVAFNQSCGFIFINVVTFLFSLNLVLFRATVRGRKYQVNSNGSSVAQVHRHRCKGCEITRGNAWVLRLIQTMLFCWLYKIAPKRLNSPAYKTCPAVTFDHRKSITPRQTYQQSYELQIMSKKTQTYKQNDKWLTNWRVCLKQGLDWGVFHN